MNFKALLAEFIGTFALIFIGVGSVAMVSYGGNNLVGVGLAHGLTIAVMASALGAVSGGHFNPAVSFGAWLGKKISILNMIGYWIAQVVGGIAGGYAIAYLSDGAAISSIKFGLPAPAETITIAQTAGLEALGTFFLVFVVYGTAIDRRAPKVGAIFIGLTITAAILCFGPLTGASINPARYLGPAVVAKDFENLVAYIAAPLLGGGLAGLVYNYIFADRDAEMPVSELAP